MPQQVSRRSALAGLGGAVGALTMAACGRVAAGAATGVAAGRNTAGTLLWQAQAVPADQPGILAVAGRVYVTGGGQDYGNSGIYAFDAATGRRLWRTPGSSGPYPYAASASAVYGFTVTRGGATTEVSASDAATGRPLWTHDAGRMLDSAKVGWLAYAGGLVYIAAGTTEDDTAGQPAIRALDARTGRRVWRAYAGSAPQTPALAGGLVYLDDAASVTASGHLVALDATTSARRWRSAGLGVLVYPPVVVGGVACCTGGSLTQGITFGLDSRTGREIWHAGLPGLALAGTQDIVFLMEFSVGQTSSFTIWARHNRTGALAWTRHFPGQPAIAAARGVLYLGCGSRTLQAIASATGQPRWTRELHATPADLAVDSNAVYALDQNGGVYAAQA